jgi:hypothetical protein
MSVARGVSKAGTDPFMGGELEGRVWELKGNENVDHVEGRWCEREKMYKVFARCSSSGLYHTSSFSGYSKRNRGTLRHAFSVPKHTADGCMASCVSSSRGDRDPYNVVEVAVFLPCLSKVKAIKSAWDDVPKLLWRLNIGDDDVSGSQMRWLTAICVLGRRSSG